MNIVNSLTCVYIQIIKSLEQHRRSLFDTTSFHQEVLGLVNLGGQVWRPALIRVVQQHNSTVVFLELLHTQVSFLEL